MTSRSDDEQELAPELRERAERAFEVFEQRRRAVPPGERRVNDSPKFAGPVGDPEPRPAAEDADS